ncbi:hypothetical protein Tco_0162056 [Tanacetum coccineum]
MCDKKNKVLFTDSECLVLSPKFKLPDKNQVLLRIPRQNNMYSFNLENIVPSGGLACLICKAIIDESNKWTKEVQQEANHKCSIEDKIDDVNSKKEANLLRNYFLLLICLTYTSTSKHKSKDATEALRKEFAQETKDLLLQADFKS